MNPNDYKPNSHKYKEAMKNESSERRVSKVVSSPVKTKKNELRKFTDVFVSEDAANVKSYIIFDVLVPAIKNTILDIIIDSASMIFKGETGRSKRSSNVPYVSYGSFSDKNKTHHASPSSRTRFEYDDLAFESRVDADVVKDNMLALIDEYGVVTVSDLYDMCDRTAPYTANKYGWDNRTDVRNADIVRTHDGYVIKLPKARPVTR